MFSSKILLSLCMLSNLSQVIAVQWADIPSNAPAPMHPYNGTAYNTTVVHATTTSTTTTALLPEATKESHKDEFHIRVTRSGRRYQTSKRYWAFSGNDAIVTDDLKTAAWFHFDSGYLKFEDKYVSLDGASGYSVLELSKDAPSHDFKFWKSDDGDVEVSGDKFTIGKGQGIFCASDDGNIFVIESKKPSFRCQRLDLHSNVHIVRLPGKRPSPNRGSGPRPTSPAGNDQSNHAVHGGPSHGHSNPKPTPASRPASHPTAAPRPTTTLISPLPHRPQPHNAQPSHESHNGRPSQGSHNGRPSHDDHRPHHDQPYDDDQEEHEPSDTEPTPTENDWQDSNKVNVPKPDPSADLDDDIEKGIDLPGKVIGGLVNYWGDAQ